MPSHTLRHANSADAPFMYGLAELTMRTHVEALGKRWSVTKMQDKCAQDSLDPNYRIVQVAAEDCGFFCAEMTGSEVLLHAIVLHPKIQGQGIGTHLLYRVLQMAAQATLPVTLNVAKTNPARAFYEKFGFVVTGEDALHLRMQREA